MPPQSLRSVLILLTSFDAGGTERQMVELIRRLDRQRFSVHVACFHDRGMLKAAARERASSLTTFPLQSFRNVSALRQLIRFARWCRHIDARIVHTCDYYANVFGLPGAAMAGVPVRIGSRRELLTADKTSSQFALQRLGYRTAHAIVGNSHAAVDQLRREGVPPDKIHLIRNGLDLTAFPYSPRRPSRIRRITMVANLRVEKGHDTLLQAAARILREHQDVEFHLIGDGPLRGPLERQIQALGLGSRVLLMGYRDDVPALLETSDLFVLPTRSEASPNAVLEAMGAGLPVVATRVGGIPELIDSGLTGILVEPGDADALAGAILALIARPDAAAALGRAARAHVRRSYSFDTMVSSFEALYLTALEGRQPSARLAGELATP
jgi:glycosyltransferase involved in cell wall biosynthesis